MEMNSKRNLFLLGVGLALMTALTGCGEKQLPAPGVETAKPNVGIQLSAPTAQQGLEMQIKAAAELAGQGRYGQALSIYNTLFALGDADKQALSKSMGALLSKAPVGELQSLADTLPSHIPQADLQYWLGVALVREKSYEQALQVFSGFIGAHPDHGYAKDAEEVLAIIHQMMLSKETIGCLLPLSGKYGIYGQRALKGVQMAVQEMSRRHQRPFRVIIKDTGSDPARAAACVEELNQANVVAILGPLLAVDTAGERAQELGIPMIALTQKTDFPLKGDYLFSNFMTPEMQVETLAGYAFGELGLKRVAIFYPDERYGERYRELFWDAADAYGGQVVGVEAYDGRKTDFTKPIRKLTGEAYPIPDYLKELAEKLDSEKIFIETAVLKGRPHPIITEDPMVPEFDPDQEEEEEIEIQFDAVFIPDDASRISLILPQLAYNDARDVYLLGTNLWHDNALLKETKGYNRNAVITEGYFSKSQRPATRKFETDFKRLFKKGPKFLEAVSYDTAVILFESIMTPGVHSREDLKNTLAGTRIFEGVTGNTIFEPSGQARKQLFLLTIKRNRFVEVRP